MGKEGNGGMCAAGRKIGVVVISVWFGLEALPSVPDSLNRREKKGEGGMDDESPHSYGQGSQYGFFPLFYLVFDIISPFFTSTTLFRICSNFVPRKVYFTLSRHPPKLGA